MTPQDKVAYSNLGRLKGGLHFFVEYQRDNIAHLVNFVKEHPDVIPQDWRIKDLQTGFQQIEKLLAEVTQ
jgi:hypothetical protein